MTEKNQQEKNAAERQVALLVNAFDKAQENGGVWLNKDGKKAPSFYQKGRSMPSSSDFTVTRTTTRPTNTPCSVRPRNVVKAYSQVRKVFLSIGTTGTSTRARKILT